MRVFQIKGFSGMVMFFLAILGVAALAVLLPTAFVMVLWNATVFESLHGPEIHMGQALLLWSAILILVKLIVNPQISLQFKRISDPAEIEKQLRDSGKSKRKE